MPTAVLMMIGQIAVMKITKIADGCASRKAASESGSQASGGTVRSTWKIGSRPRMAHTALSDQRAERDADDGGEREADGDALQAGRARARTGPCPCAPRSKNGSTISSQASSPDRWRAAAASRRWPAAQHLPDEQDEREHDQRRHDAATAARPQLRRRAGSSADGTPSAARRREHLGRRRGRRRSSNGGHRISSAGMFMAGVPSGIRRRRA